ncbi:MAG: hypothetical protein HRU14_06530 [Planctomycetes bacterium]|nr:hypothetical protein [Planctomycetota bacterium]
MKTTWLILAALLWAAACSDEGAGDGGSPSSTLRSGGQPGNGTAAGENTASESQFVITLHVKGGDEAKLNYLRSQVRDFGTCAEAKMDTNTWMVYALMKPGVPRKFAEEERVMLEAYVRPPQELLMSSWAYNEGDWFALIGN